MQGKWGVQIAAATVFFAAGVGGYAGEMPPRSLGLSNGPYAQVLLSTSRLSASPTRVGLGSNLMLGYRYNDLISTDFGYVMLPNQHAHSDAWFAAVAFRYTVSARWDAQVAFGPAYARGQRASDRPRGDDTVLYASAGATYWFKKRLGGTMGLYWTGRGDNVPSSASLGAGLVYFL